jgi:hypothetical protein
MHRHRIAHNHLAGVGIVALALTSACGLTTSQRAAVRSFSSATAALGEATSGEFVGMRDEVIRMNTARAELAPPGSIEGPLDGPFSAEAVVVRTQAATVLHDYGALLQALVDDTQEQELQTASDRFVASVRGLPAAQKQISETQLASIGRLVQVAGGLIVEYKKRQAIRQIVPAADPQVATLCDLLAADFDPDGANLAAGHLLAANALLADAGTQVRRASNPATRTAATDAYQLATAARNRRLVHARAKEAALELKAANKNLADAVASNEISVDDLKNYATTVKTLVDTIKALQ